MRVAEVHDGRGQSYRAGAGRSAPDIHPTLGIMLHLSAVALTRQMALAHALAKILRREEPPDPGVTGLTRGRRR